MEKILIGKIVNTHGIKGELKVLSETDFKTERYRLNRPIYIQTPQGFVTFQIKSYRPHQGFDLLTLQGLDNINLVEKFRGCALFADDEPIETLPENEFKISALLQKKVFQSDRCVGTVTGIRTYPQGDYLEITKLDGTLGLVPFRDEFISRVDAASGVIEVVDMEGLL